MLGRAEDVATIRETARWLLVNARAGEAGKQQKHSAAQAKLRSKRSLTADSNKKSRLL